MQSQRYKRVTQLIIADSVVGGAFFTVFLTLSSINIYSGCDTNHVSSSNTLHLSEKKIIHYFTVGTVSHSSDFPAPGVGNFDG